MLGLVDVAAVVHMWRVDPASILTLKSGLSQTFAQYAFTIAVCLLHLWLVLIVSAHYLGDCALVL